MMCLRGWEKLKIIRPLGRLDSAENILANKVTALLDREEPKDLADIWGFCCRKNLSLQAAITDAQSKAAGVFSWHRQETDRQYGYQDTVDI